jgi:hypothetical protein
MKWIKWIDTMVAVAIVALVMMARGPSMLWAAALNANATCGSTPCGSGFNMSYHDFVNGPGKSSHGTVLINGTNVSVGQCTLCHTPHNALQSVMLWNHHISNNTNFSWTDATATMAGTQFASFPNTYGGPTTKCLSCHDGSVSPSTINWFEGATPTPGTPSCTTTGGVTTCTHAPAAGFNGIMNGTHPVAMPYPCGGVANSYNGVTTGAGLVFTEFLSNPNPNIQLYTDTGGPTGTISHAPSTGCTGTNNGMECGSCHDVHNSAKVQDIDLLRGAISGSAGYLCNNCHNK